MGDKWAALQSIAEERILAAQKAGEFEDLPGAGLPLHLEDMTNVPEELKLAYRVLKNAGYVPKEVAMRKEIASLAELLENCEDEQKCSAAITRLRYLMEHLNMGSERHAALEAHDDYYQKVLGRIGRYSG